MNINQHNILQHELIGLKAEIGASRNSSMMGLCGAVVDETRNMLVIETERKNEKRRAKAESTFIFELGSGVRVRVKGDRLVSRPEDRIKK